MEKIAFIGSYDKADLIIYVAKILANMGKKVLVVDTTILQKTRYIVPTMQAPKQYITTFEEVDIAIGFQTFEQIKQYKAMDKDEEFEYEYCLLDIDSYRGYYYFGIKTDDRKYFVTSFDIYNLKRGLQVFRKLEAPIQVTKVLFTKDMLDEEDQYLNYLSRGLRIRWNSNILFFPFERGDQNAIFSNQRTGRIQLRGLSSDYIGGISFIAEEISGESQSNIRKAVKMMERN